MARFSESFDLKIDRDECTAVIEPGRFVFRRIFAGNFEYRVGPAVAGKPGERTLYQLSRQDALIGFPFGRYKGAVPRCGKDEVCERKRIAGADALCRSTFSLFSGTIQCAAIGPERVRGYLLLDSHSDDTLSGSKFEVTAIDGNAQIDDTIFNWDSRGWLTESGIVVGDKWALGGAPADKSRHSAG
jgi:hypothetical protein